MKGPVEIITKTAIGNTRTVAIHLEISRSSSVRLRQRHITQPRIARIASHFKASNAMRVAGSCGGPAYPVRFAMRSGFGAAERCIVADLAFGIKVVESYPSKPFRHELRLDAFSRWCRLFHEPNCAPRRWRRAVIREDSSRTIHGRQKFLRDDSLQGVGQLKNDLALCTLKDTDDTLQSQCDARECKVASTRCPVSAAFSAVPMAS